ncbi:TPA: phosphopyruvate hydratase, partial [Klebsiella pneumoniae]
KLLKARGLLCGVADEGGFWPDFASHTAIFDFVMEAIEAAGYRPGVDMALSLDIAASDLFHDGHYHLKLEQKVFTPQAFRQQITDWCNQYPVVSIEDPFADTDTASWQAFTAQMSGRLQIIGDDLFTTNPARIQAGVEQRLANSVLIKLNQIGTVSETLAAIAMTQQAGWTPVVSARSGETEDAFISHLAVATSAGQLKVGSFSRSERMVKWNEVIRIARQLGDQARFIGADIFRR